VGGSVQRFRRRVRALQAMLKNGVRPFQRSSCDPAVWRAATQIAEAMTTAREGTELGQTIMDVVNGMVGCDLGSLVTLAGGEDWTVCGQIGDNRYLAEHNWRTVRALTPTEVRTLSTGFIDDGLFTSERKARIPLFHEFLFPNGLRAMTARQWFQNGRVWGLGIARTRSSLSDHQRRQLEQVFPFIGAATRVAGALLSESRSADPRPGGGRPWGLTVAQERTMSLVIRGLTNRETAAVLGASVNTVRNTLVEIFRKVGVSTRSELTFLAGVGCSKVSGERRRAPEQARRDAYVEAVASSSREDT